MARMEQPKVLTGDEKQLFDIATAAITMQLQMMGVPFNRVPTLLANILSTTIAITATLHPEINHADLLEAMINDLRRMAPIHLAQTQANSAMDAAETTHRAGHA